MILLELFYLSSSCISVWYIVDKKPFLAMKTILFIQEINQVDMNYVEYNDIDLYK